MDEIKLEKITDGIIDRMCEEVLAESDNYTKVVVCDEVKESVKNRVREVMLDSLDYECDYVPSGHYKK